MSKLRPSNLNAEEIILDDNSSASIETVQAIHKTLTQKSTKLGRSFREYHVITFDEVRQLILKLNQAMETLEIRSLSCSVSLFHSGGEKATFSSFEEFEKFDTSHSKPTTQVQLSFNCLVVSPNTRNVETYELTVELASTEAQRREVKDMSNIPGYIINAFMTITGNLEVKYEQYAMAKFLESIVVEWYQSVKKRKKSSILKLGQQVSEWFPEVSRVVALVCMALVLVLGYSGRDELNLTVSNFSIAIASFLIVFSFSHRLGRFIENLVDGSNPSSLLVFCKGDEAMRDEIGAGSAARVFSALAGLMLQFLVSLGAGFLILFLT